MVVKSGTIPASSHSFPGMEHDGPIFNGQSQEPPSNGISEIVGTSDSFDDEREIEAAAAATDPLLKSPVKSCIEEEQPEISTVLVPPEVPPDVPPDISAKHSLPPLHINVNDCPKLEQSIVGSCNSESSTNGSSSGKKVFQQPSLRMPHFSNNSSASPSTIMGPPSSTNTQVLLSPAGNIHNGYQRMSAGDASTSSYGIQNRSTPKGNKQTHPLAAQRSMSNQLNRSFSNSTQGGNNSHPSSSLASPSGSGRKDHEMTRRRALVDRITKSRARDYSHLLPQAEGLSNTQTSILLRKHRGTVITEGMPYSVQQLIDCDDEPDRTKEVYVEKIKDANRKRLIHSNMDELTDVSDNEDGFDVNTQGRKSPKNVPLWTPKRVRLAGMLTRTDALLNEKEALLEILQKQESVTNSATGVRFAGEEMVPRRRRGLNGMYYLYEKTFFRRRSLNGQCSRTLPLQSWTSQRLKQDIFDESTSDKMQISTPAGVKTCPGEKWVHTGQYNKVCHLINGEKREFPENQYEEFKPGAGFLRMNELSSIDPVDFIASSEFSPFEDLQMTYMYRLSTAPSSTIRKKHGKSIYFETDERKSFEQNRIAKKKSDKKKERKPVEEASSDEENEDEAKEPSKRRPRGRPVTSKRKSSRSGVAPQHDPGIYVDYLFEDYLNEDICTKQLPNKITYASITVPHWFKISDNYWDEVPTSLRGGGNELMVSVAMQHHKLMHAERDRIKQDSDKRNRKSIKPAHNGKEDDGDDGFPPFDMGQFKPSVITSSRQFASVEKPYEQRDFLNLSDSPSSK